VRYILEGSIRRSGDRIRINVQLIDAVTGAHRWADRCDRELSDVFAVPPGRLWRSWPPTIAVYCAFLASG
jgi:TolB-like protein